MEGLRVEVKDISFFTKPVNNTNISYEEKKKILSNEETKLSTVESILKDLLFNSSITEAHELKMWLVTAIGSLPVENSVKIRKFLEALKNKPSPEFAKQFILFACQFVPKHVATLFMNKVI